MPSSKETIIDYYLKETNKYRQKYGEQTIVLLESGHFFEIYDVKPIEESPHLQCCRDIMGIMITRRDKKDDKSPYMAGIPSHSIRRYYKKLVENNYTVVCITQTTPPPNVNREVTKILSPGCSLSEDIHESTYVGQSSTIALLIEEDNDGECYAHLASFDSNLGSTTLDSIYRKHVTDCSVSKNEELFTLLTESLNGYVFHEMNIYWKANEKSNERQSENTHQELLQFANRLRKMGKLVRTQNIGKKASKIDVSFMFDRSFQSQKLERIFSHYQSIFCSIFESLGLERVETSSIATLLFLLDFVKEHDNTLIKNLVKPISKAEECDKDSGVSMTFYNEVYEKLNIFDRKDSLESTSLFKHLNMTSTKMGERLLHERLSHVCVNPVIIQSRLQLVEDIITNESHSEILKESLQMVDLHRVYRRFSIAKLQPHDIPRIVSSNNKILNLLKYICEEKNTDSLLNLLPLTNSEFKKIILNLKQYDLELKAFFNLEKCAESSLNNFDSSFFNKGKFSSIDNKVEVYEEYLNSLHIFANKMASLISSKSISVRCNDKDGHWLDISKKRGVELEKMIKEEFLKKDKDASLKTFNKKTKMEIIWHYNKLEYNKQNKSNIKITGSEIREVSFKIIHTQKEIVNIVMEEYSKLLLNLYDKYFKSTIEPLLHFIAQLDVAFSNAKVAIKYNYKRPCINESDNKSFIDAKGLRHPIIERLILEQGNAYVPSDIVLHSDKSYLLYGVNSVGKSSLLKSVAVSIIMAQAGMFVAASNYQFYPYHKMFTRTGNDDNMFRHHSSFVKEMSETKQIVKYCDDKSLIIADELCASTETDSATHIVGTMLNLISQKKASFIFATHLFTLQNHPCVRQLMVGDKTLHNIHLKVKFNNGELIFERTISQGLPENKRYGVLVAEKVIDDPFFSQLLQISYSTEDEKELMEIDNDILNDSIKCNKSNYNSSLWMDSCEICKYQPPSYLHKPLDTHHIHGQCNANESGFINHFHKNEKHNLVVLCKNCHDATHSGDIIIEGYEVSTHGKKLKYYYKNESLSLPKDSPKEINHIYLKGKKKYTDEVIMAIHDYYVKNKTSAITDKSLWNNTRKHFGINIGYQKFKEFATST